ncbi:chemotaxis protein CheW [Desulfonema magnum]|uniref:Chemotaxis protein CheW n=1 Tax=Desulfonema magnum TaxID=45655 RepID=A0A975GQ79_9BACT|nr:chemotaxis protein CheW [Desulfonema magnum]QTA88663.1 Chemotaxis protein CheW [Desulfonema magnum]
MDQCEGIQSNQYLTFRLGEEMFALEINKVREVLDITVITKVPRMPDLLKGVINLRGDAVPVIDLRLSLDMKASQETPDTCIVIVELEIDGELTQMGLLADSVEEVINLQIGQINPPPRLGTRLRTEFIKGIGKQDKNFLIILDMDKVLSEDELDVVRSVGEELKPDSKD